MGLELLALTEEDPFAREYDLARDCARRGQRAEQWDVAYGVYPRRSDLVLLVREDGADTWETRQLYEYEIGVMASGERIVQFAYANHCFMCNLWGPSLSECVAKFNEMNEFKMVIGNQQLARKYASR